MKTLHPRVHGGILGRATDDAPARRCAKHGLDPIDLVVVNLYPFRETVARGAPFDEVIENIDIGGPAMIRSAAKNHERVAVVVDPADYGRVLAEHRGRGRGVRRRCASSWRARPSPTPPPTTAPSPATWAGSSEPDAALADFPATLHPALQLRARAALRREPAPEGGVLRGRRARAGPSLARAEVLQGKELSYNNLLDLDAALKLCAEFAAPAAVIIKHTNPCGVAIVGARAC